VGSHSAFSAQLGVTQDVKWLEALAVRVVWLVSRSVSCVVGVVRAVHCQSVLTSRGVDLACYWTACLGRDGDLSDRRSLARVAGPSPTPCDCVRS